MSFIKDIAAPLGTAVGSAFGGPVGGAIGGALGGVISGSGSGGAHAANQSAAAQESAARSGINELRSSGQQAQGFFDPFGQVGQQGVAQSGFLGDPQAQFDFLQNNPLFQLSLDNANRQTNARAASTGRLGAGDTLSQLSNNVLLSAQPLLNSQRGDILNQLRFGANLANQQANVAQTTGNNISDLLTGIGAVQAGGIVGANNARAAGSENIANLAGTALGSFDFNNLFNNSPPPSSGGGGGFGQGQNGAFVNNNIGSNIFGGP